MLKGKPPKHHAPMCSTCGTEPRRPGARTCRGCHRDESKAARGMKRAEHEWLLTMLAFARTKMSKADQEALAAWEDSDEFTRTSEWPGWEKLIGAKP